MNPDTLSSRSTAPARTERLDSLPPWARIDSPLYFLSVIAVCLLLVFLPTPLLPLALIAALALFVVRWFLLGSPCAATPLNPLILLLSVALGIGLVISPAPSIGVRTAAQFWGGVLAFFAIQDFVSTPAPLTRLIGGVVVACAAVGLSRAGDRCCADGKIVRYRLGSGRAGRANPLLSGAPNPNTLAGVLAMAIPLALALIMSGNRRWGVAGALALLPSSPRSCFCSRAAR